jgi:hypothetical protein
MALMTVSEIPNYKRSSRTLTMTKAKRLLTSPGVAREINFYLSLNRHGRMLLRPPGGTEAQWALASGSRQDYGPRDVSLLFYFLQNKPSIGMHLLNRKRKNRVMILR